MDSRFRELEALENSKQISKLQKEELELLRKLRDNMDEQNAEAAKLQREQLEQGAVEGDLDAQNKLEEAKIHETEEKERQEIRDDIAKKQEEHQKEQQKAEEKDAKTPAAKQNPFVKGDDRK